MYLMIRSDFSDITSQLVDTVCGSMLLNIVTFGYTEVYPSNQMAGPCDVRYTLIQWF